MKNDGLTFPELRQQNVARCEAVFHHVGAWTPAEWAVALAGEAGETCNAVKKLRRVEDGTNTAKDPQSYEEAVEAIGQELADVVIYADLLAARLGLDLGLEVVKKFNSVSMLRRSEIFLGGPTEDPSESIHARAERRGDAFEEATRKAGDV